MSDDIRLLGIDHVGAPVWNADTAAAFFERAGKEVVIDEVLPEYNIRAVFLDFDGVYLEFSWNESRQRELIRKIPNNPSRRANTCYLGTQQPKPHHRGLIAGMVI